MTVLFGPPVERRAEFGSKHIIPRPGDEGGSFAKIDLSRAESSLQKVAVWASVNLVRTIAEILPLAAYTGQGSDRRPVRMPGWLEDLGADGHGLSDWCGQAVYSGMLRGNVVGLTPDGARRAGAGTPTIVALQHPDECRARRNSDSGAIEWRVAGKLVDTSSVWHRRVHSIPGEIMGLSPIAMHALTIGTGIAAARFGRQWFEDGGHPSALLTSDQPLGQTAARTAKQRFLDALRGTREPVVLGHGWKFQAIQIAPNESQFLETAGYTGAECCRIFGPALAEVLGYDTGGSLTYANIEQRGLDLLTFAADPWLVRLERWLSELLPAPQYVKFTRAALVKSDLKTRYEAHELALRNRWMTVNDVRDVEDMPRVGWGDEPNFTTYTYAKRDGDQTSDPGPGDGGQQQ